MKRLKKFFKYSVLPALMVASTQVFAAIPQEATAALNELKADASSMAGNVWGLMLATVGVFFLARLFKRVIRSS